MITKITNGKLITRQIEEGKSLYFENGVITDITDEPRPFDKEIDAGGNYVSPGFIDIHTHGAGGADFMDGTVEDVINAVAVHKEHGTTSVFPTLLTATPELIRKGLQNIKLAMDASGGPNILGSHVEGPYFSLSQKGAQDPRYIRNPDKNEYSELIKIGEGSIKRWSFAPELEGSVEFCRFMHENGVVTSIAHSDAIYDDVIKVYNEGCKLITHFYSATSTITRVSGFRRLGVIETGYLLDDMKVEAIADGCHLPPELLMLIYKIKGPDNICLVTDSMRAAGQDVKETVLGDKEDGIPCIIEDGVAKLYDRSAFAGSIATADRLVRTMYKSVGIPLETSVKMITEVPAGIMGLDKKGKLQKGYDADIVIFDENINVKTVIVGGRI